MPPKKEVNIGEQAALEQLARENARKAEERQAAAAKKAKATVLKMLTAKAKEIAESPPPPKPSADVKIIRKGSLDYDAAKATSVMVVCTECNTVFDCPKKKLSLVPNLKKKLAPCPLPGCDGAMFVK